MSLLPDLLWFKRENFLEIMQVLTVGVEKETMTRLLLANRRPGSFHRVSDLLYSCESAGG